MRVVLADVRGSSGFVSKDTVAGGYGSRLRPFSKVTRIISWLKGRFHDVPSAQLASIAALAANAGHTVRFTRDEVIDGDVAIVLSSLVDFHRETAYADTLRARGVHVGFVGLAASKLPGLFAGHADFIVNGEPESAVARLFAGEALHDAVVSEPVANLDDLPFPRWDLLAAPRRRIRVPWSGRPAGGGFPLLTSRGCPEFCTYCPHRILAGYRGRSVDSIMSEIAALIEQYPNPYVIFRDPLFTQDRDRCVAFAEAVRRRGLRFRFECETRLDRLDPALLTELHAAGLRAMSFGVESLEASTLKKAGRRPTPESHQRLIIDHCRTLGIVTAAFYVLGFLEDDWASISATIQYANDLGSTVAQFKLLTPYPGTPLWKQMASRVYETDWEQFDGFTPTFTHPNLSAEELRFLLGAAYTRFYMRPSYLANYCRVEGAVLRHLIDRLDERVSARQARWESATMSRAVLC
jgi:anaerobic magnesium-protoporphyrin IX monomethyl ester cyclase